MTEKAAPVDKYAIIEGTGFGDRAVSYALSELSVDGSIRQSGKRSRRILWECVSE
jgi:hypothetical protein